MADVIVFLDFDGVICTEATYGAERRPRGPHVLMDHKALIDPDLVANVQELCERTGAKIVLSTAWRTIPATAPHIRDWLREKGLTAEIIGETPEMFRPNRGTEIRAWIGSNETEGMRWVALDDDHSCVVLGTNWVESSFYGEDAGFTKEHLEQAVRVLEEQR